MAGILGISMQGDKRMEANEEGRLGGRNFGNQHAGRQMKGDK